MSVTATKQSNVVNGIDVDALEDIIEQVKDDPAKGLVEFRVKSEWKGQTRSQTSIDAGGGAFYRSVGLERLFRDAQACRYHPLQEGAQRTFAGRLALGQNVDAA